MRIFLYFYTQILVNVLTIKAENHQKPTCNNTWNLAHDFEDKILKYSNINIICSSESNQMISSALKRWVLPLHFSFRHHICSWSEKDPTELFMQDCLNICRAFPWLDNTLLPLWSVKENGSAFVWTKNRVIWRRIAKVIQVFRPQNIVFIIITQIPGIVTGGFLMIFSLYC
jgi:hypothetical protein